MCQDTLGVTNGCSEIQPLRGGFGRRNRCIQLFLRIPIIRLEPQRLLIVRHRFLALTLPGQRHPEVKMGFGIIGL